MPIRSKDTIAIIEDDSVAQSSLAAVIDSIGMECQAFTTAEEFLERGIESSLSCIVIDLRLPGMSGMDLLARFSEYAYLPPVIFITGFATIPLAVEMMRGGAYTVLEKPCLTQELRETLRMAVARHHALEQQREKTRQLRERFEALSEVEWHVVRRMAEGTPNALIAQELNLGLRTIEKRRQQILRRLNVDSLPALIRLLYQADPELVRSLSPDPVEHEDRTKRA